MKPSLTILLVFLVALPVSAQLIISEFAAIDANHPDGDGDTPDWIELRNLGQEALDLGGSYLSDDPDDLTKWQFPPNTTIQSLQHLVVFASAKTNPPANELHTNFRLAGSGEYLALVAADGTTVLDSYAPSYPQQYANTSYGRIGPDQHFYFPNPTPGRVNIGGLSDPTVAVQFEPRSRILHVAQAVTLSAAPPEAVIRYTTDGSDPHHRSPVYTAPILINRTMEIRARIFLPDEQPGPVNSASYLRLSGDTRRFTSPLPIVIIENFGGGNIPDKRAHNPPAGDGGGLRQVKRQPAFLTIIEPGENGVARLSDDPALTTRMGIRVRGSSSANQPQKKENYSIEAWSAVDEDQVNIRPLGLPADNDFLLYAPYRYDRALFRNAFAYETMRLMGHYAARTRFVQVFVNTEGDPLSMNDFAGVFLFLEKVKRSNDRVNIDNLSDDGTRGGWLLESNRMDPLPEDGSFTQPFNFHTAGPNRRKEGPYGGSGGADRGGDDIPTGYNTFLNFVEPTGYDTTAAQRRSIISWFDRFENALYGRDWQHPERGYRKHLDVESFIDHHLMVNLARNVDGLQLSTFLYRPHTYGKLHLNPVWDYDRSMESYDGRDDATTGQWGQQFLWFPRLFADREFAQQVADRWQELRRGVLSTVKIHARIDAMAAEITAPVAAANFSRWPSNNSPRSGGWPSEIAHLKNWLSVRAAWLDRQYITPPGFSPAGGSFENPVSLRMTGTGTIFYTTDGTDPRSPAIPGVGNGGPAPNALRYTTPLEIDAPVTITARLLRSGRWSGPVRSSYLVATVPASRENLAITEIMYRPVDASEAEEQASYKDRDEFEFLELANLSATDTIDLTGVSLVEVDLEGDNQGINFTFNADNRLLFLAPGARAVLVENEEAFRLRYGHDAPIAGQYRNALSNDGERLTLLDRAGNPIQVLTYNDQLPWPTSADGDGYSLTYPHPGFASDLPEGLQWLPSAEAGGTPGSSDSTALEGDPLRDEDGDGLTALLEFALGTSDQDPSSGRDHIQVSRNEESVIFSYAQNLRAANLVLIPESSTNLIDWTNNLGVEDGLSLSKRTHKGDGTETMEWTFPDNNGQLFLRLRVQALP